MFKKLLLVIGGALLLVMIAALLKSPHYEVSREILISAPKDTTFSYLIDSKKLDAWMPWKETDPSVKMSFEGPASGVGAITKWESEGRMGVGSATITELAPNEWVKTRIEYFKPFTMVQESEMRMVESPTGILVSWTVRGENNFIGRVFCLFASIDKQVGPQFEKGLSKLKLLAEAPQK